MENRIPFSVVISVYKKDKAEHFDLALQSVTINQSVKPNEVVLIVDGPVSDEINQVIQKYEMLEVGLKVFRLSKNKGLGNALNIANQQCTNELIAHMDSDDISIPIRFEQQLSLFEDNPEIDIVGGNITEFIDEDTNIVSRRPVPCTDAEIKEYMKYRCAMNHVTVMYKKSSVLKSGNYKEWFCNEDYYLWIRMMEENCIFANTGTDLVNVRIGKDMYQRRGGKRYFQSEKELQKYMLDRHIIGKRVYISNVVKRWIVQRFLPNSIRGFVFRKFARE